MQKTAGKALLYLLLFGVAGYALIAYILLPPATIAHPDLQVTYSERPYGIYLHDFVALLA